MAADIASVLFVILLGLLFSDRLYYLGFCLLLVQVGGKGLLPYAPLFWLPIEVVTLLRNYLGRIERAGGRLNGR